MKHNKNPILTSDSEAAVRLSPNENLGVDFASKSSIPGPIELWRSEILG